MREKHLTLVLQGQRCLGSTGLLAGLAGAAGRADGAGDLEDPLPAGLVGGRRGTERFSTDRTAHCSLLGLLVSLITAQVIPAKKKEHIRWDISQILVYCLAYGS